MKMTKKELIGLVESIVTKKLNEIKDISFGAGRGQFNTTSSTPTAIIYFDTDGWDSQRQAYQDIESFAAGYNDMISEEWDEYLENNGWSLVYPGELIDDDVVSFKLEKL